MERNLSKKEFKINRGWSSSGAYFYYELPDGTFLENTNEGALIELIEKTIKKQKQKTKNF